MFHPDHQQDLVTFDQREQRLAELIRDLGVWLLQQQVNADPLVRPPEDLAVACPRCHRNATRLTLPDDPLPSRRLTTLIGEVELQREKWTCRTCRLVFFPP